MVLGNNPTRLWALILLFTFVPFVVPLERHDALLNQSPTPSKSFKWNSNGPYVNKVLFDVISERSEQLDALTSGSIEHVTTSLSAGDVSYLSSYGSTIEVTQTESFDLVFMAINCQRYPWIFPEFRRALALAMDKNELASIMWGDLGFALDATMSPSCGVWHNDALTPSYNDSQVAAAQAELASAGFFDLEGDGYVEAPNGDQINFRPMYPIEVPQWAAALSSQQPYWDAAGIRVTPMPVALNTLLDIVHTIPRNYDGAFITESLSQPFPLFLQNFVTIQIANPDGNILNWQNSYYDTIIEQMLTSSDSSTVHAAVHEAQQIINTDVSLLVIGGTYEFNAHRTDDFAGWITSPGYGISALNHWTPRKVHLLNEGIDGGSDHTGGIFNSMLGSAVDSQNPLTSTSEFGQYVLSQVYTSLMGDTNPYNNAYGYNGLANLVTLESHPNGLKYTFHLFQNASWHNDDETAPQTSVTADDVEFSYNYIIDNNIPLYQTQIPYLNACYKLDEWTVEIITNGDSYWAFNQICDWVILPSQIWSGIVSPVTFINPQPLGCGFFRWENRVEGEYVLLNYWEHYHKPIYRTPASGRFPIELLISVVIGVVVVLILVISCYFWMRRSNKTKDAIDRAREDDTVEETQIVYCMHCGAQLVKTDDYCSSCGRIKD